MKLHQQEQSLPSLQLNLRIQSRPLHQVGCEVKLARGHTSELQQLFQESYQVLLLALQVSVRDQDLEASVVEHEQVC